MSERCIRVSFDVMVPVEDYDDTLSELLGGVERAARDLHLAYTTPAVRPGAPERDYTSTEEE